MKDYDVTSIYYSSYRRILTCACLWQEKELALAANRFAECQKTIASLGQQLKSLTTLEDILVDSERPPELIEEGMQCHINSVEPHNLHPNLNTARVV